MQGLRSNPLNLYREISISETMDVMWLAYSAKFKANEIENI